MAKPKPINPREQSSKWRDFYERRTPLWLKHLFKLVEASPNEAFVLSMILSIAMSTYVAWMLVVLPVVWKDSHPSFRILSYLSASFVVHGALAHLWLICRDSVGIPPLVILPTEPELGSGEPGKQARKHVNFLGFLFYMGLGGLSASMVGFRYAYMIWGDAWLMKILKCFLYWNAVLDPISCLTIIAGLGSAAMFAYFRDYVCLVTEKQASIENTKAGPSTITIKPSIKDSYKLFKVFLGPSGIPHMLLPTLIRPRKVTQENRRRQEVKQGKRAE